MGEEDGCNAAHALLQDVEEEGGGGGGGCVADSDSWRLVRYLVVQVSPGLKETITENVKYLVGRLSRTIVLRLSLKTLGGSPGMRLEFDIS